MSTPELPLIIEAQQTLPLLKNKPFLLVDLSDASSYQAHHIPGAIHIDYHQLTSDFPNTAGELGPNAPLTKLLQQLGLSETTHIIAYDNGDNARACRLLWTLDLIGHKHYSLLNGGLTAWLDDGHPLTDQATVIKANRTVFKFCETAPWVNLLYLLTHLDNKKLQLVDARTPEEYAGKDVRGTRGGHIPNAINLDYRQLISSEQNQRFKPAKELRAIVKTAGLKAKQETICYCHTHRRSALVYIALKSIGFEQLKAYPGSFSEWGNNLDTPIE